MGQSTVRTPSLTAPAERSQLAEINGYAMRRCSRCGSHNLERYANCRICGEMLTNAAPERIIVQCQCGELYFATERQVGKSLRCSCGAILVVGKPMVATSPGPFDSQATGPALSEPASPVLGSIALWLAGLCAVLVAADVAYQASALRRLTGRLSDERAGLRQQHEETVWQELESSAAQSAAEEATHQARLQNEALVSGALAREQHSVEWARRLAHDPESAKSTLERTLLRMEQVGHDPKKTAQQALEEVARLAAPAGSRVEVRPTRERFAVQVAFRMSALSANEAGAVTKHLTTESMRREIRDLSARVIKALFDYCGSRGIEKLSVTCNHAMRLAPLPSNATEWEQQELLRRAPVVLGRLYRVSLDEKNARSVADWRKISVAKVGEMMTVEVDNLTTLHISESECSPQQDPQGQLEF